MFSEGFSNQRFSKHEIPILLKKKKKKVYICFVYERLVYQRTLKKVFSVTCVLSFQTKTNNDLHH